jgi:pyrroline-5-carboxylate reductase
MRILFLGGGNMAGAMIGGLLQQGFKSADFRVVDISEEARERLHRQYGVAGVGATDGQIEEQVVVFAVKPQQMRTVAKTVGAHLRGQLVLSIAAGIRTADLSRWLGGHERIVRAMPNTPALIRAGISGVYASAQVSTVDRDNAQSILAAIGGVVWVQNESDIDAVTAVSGSGPAYVFYFIEALEQAAVDLGLNSTQARELAIRTFTGASRLAADSDEAPAVLRARVTSKAGTTEAALQAMEAGDIKRRIASAVQAAARRSRELGDEFGRD